MATSSEVFLFGDFRFDRAGGGLFRRDDLAPVVIGSRALDLLAVLIERRGEVVSKEEIMAAVWPKMAVEEGNLFVQISALRAILDRAQSGQSCIQTVSGRGYRFIAPVTSCARGTDSRTSPTAHERFPLFRPDDVKLPFPLVEARPRKPEPSSISSAERRQLAVMVCELVGSAGLSSRLDPEDLREVIATYRRVVAKIVAGLDGFVGKHMGEYISEGVLVFFGYPTAQENDAERGVRAALAIQRALSEHNAENVSKGAPELSARIGLDCGLMLVDSTGGVFGDAPNVAARMLTAAEPGTVLVTINVLRQIPGLFVTEERGESELVGISQPVNLFRVVRASGGRRRAGVRPLTSFVGREKELGLMARRWERVQAGEGQLVLIVGEPGIGKTRLVAEFHAKLAETPHTWVEWSALQLLQNTPLHPIAEWGRMRFGVEAPAEQRLAELENTLGLVGLDPTEYAPLLAPIVDIPLPAGRVANMPSEELRRRQLEAIVAWSMAGARSQAIALLFEDLQWADPTSLDLLQRLAERGAQARLLIIATARPEFRPPWNLRTHHSVISLSSLDRAQVRQIVGELASRQALSQEMVERVSERTGGVPLFVEEVTRLLLERGVEGGGLQTIPPTLQQSLAARLDRLGEAREVAQIGAVLGRDFAYTLLRAMGGIDGRAMQSGLDRLAEADLLVAEGAGLQASYRFKHALIQDAAYESLLKSHRRALHRRAAEVLRGESERTATGPEIIAHHFNEAGLDDLAIEWWGKAGEQALRRSAFQEAIAHLGKAIAMADRKGGALRHATREQSRWRIDYAIAVMSAKGFAAEETRAALARVGEFRANITEKYPIYYAQFAWSYMRGELHQARRLAESFLREAELGGHATEAAVARRILGSTCLLQGDLMAAKALLERTLADYTASLDAEARIHFGHDVRPIAAANLASATWLLGEVENARGFAELAVLTAAELGHAPTSTNAHSYLAMFEVRRNDFYATLRLAEEILFDARKHKMDLWVAFGEVFAAWARGRRHDPGAEAPVLRRALVNYLNQGNKLFAPLFHGMLADLEAETNSLDVALTLINDGLGFSEETSERFSDPYLHRLRGDILLKRDPANPAPAEEAFRAAVAIAQAHKARSFELQSALSLANLYQSTGRPTAAHAVLTPALEGFAPTPEMPEIAEALALVERLA